MNTAKYEIRNSIKTFLVVVLKLLLYLFLNNLHHEICGSFYPGTTEHAEHVL